MSFKFNYAIIAGGAWPWFARCNAIFCRHSHLNSKCKNASVVVVNRITADHCHIGFWIKSMGRLAVEGKVACAKASLPLSNLTSLSLSNHCQIFPCSSLSNSSTCVIGFTLNLDFVRELLQQPQGAQRFVVLAPIN